MLSVNIGLKNFPYYLRTRGITITSFTIALSGDVNVDGWDGIELLELSTTTFSEDPTLGLPTASFLELGLSVSTDDDVIDLKLPVQLVNAVSGVVTDVIIICSYNVNAVSTNP